MSLQPRLGQSDWSSCANWFQGTVGFLVNPSSQITENQVKEVLEAAHALGQQVLVLGASTAEEIEQAFVGLVQRGAGAVLMSADLFFQVQRDQLVALAARHSLPVMYEWPEFVRAGGLISYSTFRADAFLQSGIYVGRILNGVKPADLPVVQSTRFELIIETIEHRCGLTRVRFEKTAS
jgi:putative ABC transport system substrate-binding protein